MSSNAAFTSGLAVMLMLSSVKTQQVIPSQYVTFQLDGVPSANGSSPSGHCSDATIRTDLFQGTIVTTCTAPSSSVLFDGIIPTLTGLDGNMWASQLLTLYVPSGDAIVHFNFSGRVEVNRVEVVIVNCQQLGTVERIELDAPSMFDMPILGSFSSTTPTETSCDSLVTVNIPCEDPLCNNTLLGLQFNAANSANFIYIAEIRFCGNNDCLSPPSSGNTITTPPPPPDTTIMPRPPADTTITTPTPLPDTTITTPPDTTISTETSPPNITITTLTPPPDNTISTETSPPNTTIPKFTNLDTTLIPNSTTSGDNNSNLPSIILPILLVLLFVLVCVVGVVLLLWRCYRAKHHKHNTTALGEGTHASPHPHSHPPPITLCEETGQALYSVVQDKANNSHYNTFQDNTTKMRGDQKEMLAVSHEEEKEECSTLSQTASQHKLGEVSEEEKEDKRVYSFSSQPAVKPPSLAFPHSEVDTVVNPFYTKVKIEATDPHPSDAETVENQLYAQVARKKDAIAIKKDPNYLEINTAVDNLSARVDKDAMTTNTYTTETKPAVDHPSYAAVDQLYTQVNKNKSANPTMKDQQYAQVDTKNDTAPVIATPVEANTTVDQLYPQVDKTKKVPTSDLAMDEPYAQVAAGLNPCTLETNTAIDQQYAQVDKMKKETIAPNTQHSTSENQPFAQVDKAVADTPETNTAVDQLYAPKKNVIAPNSQHSISDSVMNQLYAQVDKIAADTPESSTAVDQLYAQVDKKNGRANMAHSSEANTAVDQLYAQVDNKSKTATKIHSSDSTTAVGPVYAQVNKKKSDSTSTTTYPSETETVDQMYAKVDKKNRKKSKEISENSAEESDAVYSVVNKPRAPQLPPKSDLLMEDEPTPPQLPMADYL